MAMSRKHYKAFAESLNFTLGMYRDYTKQDAVRSAVECIADDIADICKKDNSAFDRYKFMDAVFKGHETR